MEKILEKIPESVKRRFASDVEVYSINVKKSSKYFFQR